MNQTVLIDLRTILVPDLPIEMVHVTQKVNALIKGELMPAHVHR